MQTAIITGATQGIGKAIAEKFLTEGFSIAFCARNAWKVADLTTKWKSIYPKANIYGFQADLSAPLEVKAFAEKCLNTFDHIDILVNNTGAYLPGLIANEPDGLLTKMIETNLYSAYNLTRAILPTLLKQQTGHIFNMCSIASLRAYPNGGAYSISKYALMGFSENLREELKDKGIKVTAVCPGATYTPSWEGSGVSPDRIMEAGDIATMVWSASQLSPGANVETIILRPQLGDL